MLKALLTPKDLADAIGTSESSMRRWIDAGKVKMTRTAGGHRRIELNDALRFVREGGFPIVRPDILGVTPLKVPPRVPRESDDDRLHAALAAGDRALARALLVSWYLGGRSLAALFDGPIRAALTRLGEGWNTQPRCILTEHRATDVCIEVLGTDGPVMEPVTFDLDRLSIDRRLGVVLLNELNHHVAGKGDGESQAHVGRLASIPSLRRHERTAHKPRPDIQRLHIMHHRLIDVFDRIGCLHQSADRLSE